MIHHYSPIMVKMMMVINTHTFHDIDDKHYSNDDQRIEIGPVFVIT